MLAAGLPILHMIEDDLGTLVGTVLATEGLDEVAVRVHDVEVDAVVDEVVLPRLDVARRAEVHAVRLAHVADLVVGPREPHELLVELPQVRLQHPRVVARRVARDEHRQQEPRQFCLHQVVHPRHLVQLVRADVRAVREAEVDLSTGCVSHCVSALLLKKEKKVEGKDTNQRIATLKLLAREGPALVIDKLEGSANLGASDTLGSFGDAQTLHALLLVLEVPDEAGAGDDEQQARLPRERARPVPAARLLHRLRLMPPLLGASAGNGAGGSRDCAYAIG